MAIRDSYRRRASSGTAHAVANKGYGDAGASRRKRSLKGFTAESGSAREDIDENNYTLRQRTRMLYMAAPIASSAVKTNRTNVVGSGLKLKSRINRELLGLTQEQADKWEKQVEAEFALWATNKKSCDATGVNDFYAMQQLVLVSWLLSGDSFTLIKHVDKTLWRPYSLRLHVIEADRVCTPNSRSTFIGFGTTEGRDENGNKIYDGVEINENGAIEAYHICDRHPTEINLISGQNAKWVRIEAYGETTELPNVLQVMDTERPEQYRGVSYLAHVIEPLLQMRRYTESELLTAVIQSFFTAFITTEESPDKVPFNETSDEKVSSSPDDYELGAGTVNILKPGESVTFGEPKRPANGFDTFMRAIAEQVGASLEIPADLLLKSFNASYSASRAALLEAWKAFKMRREWFASDFCKPVYLLWMCEAVSSGRIKAPGFFTDPIIRQAWLGSEWIGPSQGQLDPVKEITAEILAIEQGITTREQATVKMNGGDWNENMDIIARENEKLSQSSMKNEIVTEVIKSMVKEGTEVDKK